jgi:hypothetical protein
MAKALEGISRDLAKAVIKSGNVGHLLLCFFFVVGVSALIVTAAMGQWLVFTGVIILSLAGMAVAAFLIIRIDHAGKPVPPRIEPFDRAKQTQENVLVCLQGICQTASARLGVDQRLLRSNVFREWSDGMLRIVPEWHHNMTHLPEWGIALPRGYGSTGNAYERKTAVIARALGGWGDYVLNAAEMGKVHPDLKWIISTPIPMPRGSGEIFGVVNVDCLQEDRTVDELRPLQEELLAWAFQIGEIIDNPHEGA